MTLFAPGTPPEVIDQVNSSLGMSSPSSVSSTTTADIMGGSNPTTKPFAEILKQLFSKGNFGTGISSFVEANASDLANPAITSYYGPNGGDEPTLGKMPPPPKSDDGSGGYKAVRAETPSVGGAYSDAQSGGMKSFDQFKDDYFAAGNVVPAAPSFADDLLKTEYDKYKADFNNPATPSSGATQPTSAQGPSLDYLGQMLSGGLGGYGMYQPQPQRSMFGGFGMPMMQPMYGMGMGIGGYGGYGGMGYGGFGGYGGYGGGMSPFGMGLGGYGGYGGGMPYGNMYGGGFYNTMPQQGYSTNPQSFAGESPFGAGSIFGSLGSIAQ